MSAVEYSSFLGRGVVAVTSDRSVDFQKGDPRESERFVLTAAQRGWLTAHGVGCPDAVVFPKQVHGDVIRRATREDAALTGAFEADAVVSDLVGLPIAIRTADCAPVLLYDPSRRVAAAIHAGWKSAKLGIVAKTVDILRREYRANLGELRAAIGPCIRRDGYQVGAEFKEYFPGHVVEASGGLYLDLAAAIVEQLVRSGVQPGNINDSVLCTFEQKGRFYSYRREGSAAGRMLHVIMLV